MGAAGKNYPFKRHYAKRNAAISRNLGLSSRNLGVSSRNLGLSSRNLGLGSRNLGLSSRNNAAGTSAIQLH